MFKQITSKIQVVFDRQFYSFKVHLKKSGWIGHHGLQRNGTNYLLMCLKQLDVDVINQFDPKRNRPQHKHFRWYKNKQLIPNFIKAEYFNDLYAKSVDEINKICGYPQDPKTLFTLSFKKNAKMPLFLLRTGDSNVIGLKIRKMISDNLKPWN